MLFFSIARLSNLSTSERYLEKRNGPSSSRLAESTNFSETGVLFVLAVSWLLNVPAICKKYFKDGSAQTAVRAATLRWKLQTKLALSSSHSIPTTDQSVQALELETREFTLKISLPWVTRKKQSHYLIPLLKLGYARP